MKKLGRLILLTQVVLALLFLFAVVCHAEEVTPAPQRVELTVGSNAVIIDGKQMNIDVAPEVFNGTTLLPMRFVCQDILAAGVDWSDQDKKVTVKKGELLIELWVNNKTAFVDGKEYSLNQPPLIRNSRVLVPLRFLSESTGLTVDYEHLSKKITITRSQEGTVNNAPNAYFEFVDAEVRAGQAVRVNDLSWDPEGDAIVAWEWEVVNDKGERKRVASLDEYFPVRTPGTYLVRLRVKDSNENWSQLYEKNLEVKPNQPPVIKEFEAGAKRIPQGTPLNFTYKVEDEPWDSIVEERWVYRWKDYTGKTIEVVGKPRALFGDQTYEVALKVKDSFNNWSNEAVIVLESTKEKGKSEYEFKFSDPVSGEFFINPDNIHYNSLPEAAVEVEYGGPVLILSNSPETVKSPGILYQDRVKGKVRIYYHHKNGTGKRCTFAVWVKNLGDSNEVVKINNLALAGPTTDEMFLGQRVAYQYLNSPGGSSVILNRGGVAAINTGQYGKAIANGEIISGMIELECSEQLEITLAMIELGQDYYSAHVVLSPDGIHARGTFEDGDVIIMATLKGSEPEKITLGRDISVEGFIKGRDALTGEEVVNKGNYGVLYKITVKSPTETGVIFNPRGTIFRGAAADSQGQAYLLPATGFIRGNFFVGAVMGVIPAQKEKTFLYTPPGGSDTPALIVLIPKPYW
ncbi:MAG: hypothetical protein GX088_03645 [Clostridia bacterium]|nr:hypothetical protein [Clostridia bacterium]